MNHLSGVSSEIGVPRFSISLASKPTQIDVPRTMTSMIVIIVNSPERHNSPDPTQQFRPAGSRWELVARA